MKNKLFISGCFSALLLISVVAIMPSEEKQFGETKESKVNIKVHGYANWQCRGGTISQGGDRNRNGCGGGNVINFLYSQKRGDDANVIHFPGGRKVIHSPGGGNAVNSPAVGNGGGGGEIVHFPGSGKGGGASGNVGGNG